MCCLMKLRFASWTCECLKEEEEKDDSLIVLYRIFNFQKAYAVYFTGRTSVQADLIPCCTDPR
jgi:hypothetical protein